MAVKKIIIKLIGLSTLENLVLFVNSNVSYKMQLSLEMVGARYVQFNMVKTDFYLQSLELRLYGFWVGFITIALFTLHKLTWVRPRLKVTRIGP